MDNRVRRATLYYVSYIAFGFPLKRDSKKEDAKVTPSSYLQQAAELSFGHYTAGICCCQRTFASIMPHRSIRSRNFARVSLVKKASRGLDGKPDRLHFTGLEDAAVSAESVDDEHEVQQYLSDL